MDSALKSLETQTDFLFSFWEWVKVTFTPSYQNEIELYLQDATDVFDLEERMKRLRYRGMI